MVGASNALLDAVGLLYLVRHLDLTPGLIGLVFSGAGVGWLIGASLAKQTTRKVGLGRSAAAGLFLMGACDLIIPLAGGPMAVVLALVGAATFLFGAGLVTYIIARTSLQQSMTPDRLQGRANVVLRMAFLGAIPIGALAGGALGETIGLAPNLLHRGRRRAADGSIPVVLGGLRGPGAAAGAGVTRRTYNHSPDTPGRNSRLIT